MKLQHALTTLCLLAIASYALPQANQTVESKAKAGSLQGFVYYGVSDHDQSGIENVAVAECDAGFKDCVSLTHTDGNGHFAIQSTYKGNIHYLQFLSPGWCEGRVTVTLVRSSKPVNVRLVIGS
jgi:hypothetical protein